MPVAPRIRSIVSSEIGTGLPSICPVRGGFGRPVFAVGLLFAGGDAGLVEPVTHPSRPCEDLVGIQRRHLCQEGFECRREPLDCHGGIDLAEPRGVRVKEAAGGGYSLLTGRRLGVGRTARSALEEPRRGVATGLTIGAGRGKAASPGMTPTKPPPTGRVKSPYAATRSSRATPIFESAMP